MASAAKVWPPRKPEPVQHPGHAASHATRLNRYDHTGLRSMIEEEAKWYHSFASDSTSGAKVPLPAKSETRFAQLSAPQHEKLQEHHEIVLQLNRQQVEPITQASVLSSGKMMRDIKKHVSYIDGGQAATVLVRLDTQYVGPIGVGSILLPEGCSLSDGMTPEFLPAGTENESNMSLPELRQTCHFEDESVAWVIFDTGSTNIWVASDLCRSENCRKIGRPPYNHSHSVTYRPLPDAYMLAVQFGTGFLQGIQASDDLHIGGLTVRNQTFGMIQEQTGDVFDAEMFDGILGLAFPSMAAHGSQAFFDNIISQKVLKHDEFAVYFSPTSKTANAILWGGLTVSFMMVKLSTSQ